MSMPPWLSMLRVNKFDRKAPPGPGTTLTADEVAALEKAFGLVAGSAKAGTKAFQLLDHLIKKDQWLLCNCRGAPGAQSPVMFAMRTVSPAHPLTLVRNHARGTHAESCPFYRDTQLAMGHSLAARTTLSAFGLLKKAKTTGQISTSNGTLSYGRASSERTPTLASVLFTLLEAGACDQVTATERHISADAKRVSAAAANLFMDDAKTLSAQPFIGTSLHKVDAVFKEAVRAKKDGHWPEGQELHGFVIGLCDVEKRPDGVFLKGVHLVQGRLDEWKVRGRVRMPGQGTVGPYLAIGLVACLAGETKPSIVQAYVHPANTSGNWTLVDSDLERQTFAILVSKLSQLQEGEGTYSIVKPYTDRVSPKSKVRYRPDFCLLSPDTEVFVETMGYADEEYRERKKRMHEVMSEVHQVIEHTPGSNDDELQKFLHGFVGCGESSGS